MPVRVGREVPDRLVFDQRDQSHGTPFFLEDGEMTLDIFSASPIFKLSATVSPIFKRFVAENCLCKCSPD
ncbi:hypothetical protein, partial [Xanthomonas citri]|uniref:hypothetical protein n=1 Tax=Xanthomonas citri TaxID=346 RepID=UPI001EE65CB6